MESIDFPPHRDDPPDGSLPSRCRGFSFVIFSRTADAEHLCQEYPWRSYECSTPSERVDAPVNSGLRCLSKNAWDTLKEEYLARQKRLFDRTMAENSASSSHPPRLRADMKRHTPDINYSGSTPSGGNGVCSVSESQLQKPTSTKLYPEGCLLFVKNVHPETNKTTLKNFFSGALTGKLDVIDYVDYNKGLDSVSQKRRIFLFYP